MRKKLIACLVTLAAGCSLYATSTEMDSQSYIKITVLKGKTRGPIGDYRRSPSTSMEIEAYYDDETSVLNLNSLIDCGNLEIQFIDFEDYVIATDYWVSSNGGYSIVVPDDVCQVRLVSNEYIYYINL